ncbi:MAG TPA: hypothetical protein VN445_04980 [Rectinemataceae bacterium]|nr:hypothetical protein [Rectinemataceae bacterium]
MLKLPFRTGTFRTGFVIDEDCRIKVIEITIRQSLNGYFISGFSRAIGLERAKTLGLINVIDDVPRFLKYFSSRFAPTGKICIVMGHERLGDFKIYTEIFQKAGYDTRVIELEQLPSSLEGATVIEELNHKEIMELPLDIMEVLNEHHIHNDFRILFLVHGKRFFALLTYKPFLAAALTAAESEHLARFTIPTYTWQQDRSAREEACRCKDSWILKPILFRKSEGVRAGCVTDKKIWNDLFDTGQVSGMVLQPMVKQKVFAEKIESDARNDNVADTLLYFNQDFFGPGIYRASSFVATNQGDNRKLAQLVADVDGPTDTMFSESSPHTMLVVCLQDHWI